MSGYESVAKYYDGEYAGFRRDIDFYLDRFQAERVRGPILEPACGTGRVALPIAAAGFRICAFDRSQAMLRRARRRRSGLPADVRMRLRFSCQDMTSFSYSSRFQAVVLAFSAFNLLKDGEERRSCLDVIGRHLEPGGLLFADMFNAGEAEPAAEPRPRRSEYSFRHPPYGHLVTKTVEELDDADGGAITVRYRFRERRDADDSLVGGMQVEFKLARLQRCQVEAAMYQAGFDVEEVFGDYAGRPFNSRSPRMIIQARRLA